MSKGSIWLITLILTVLSCIFFFSSSFIKAIGRGIFDFSMDLGVFIIIMIVPIIIVAIFLCIYLLLNNILDKRIYKYNTQVKGTIFWNKKKL